MPSIINATTSTGLVTTADNSGSLQLATNSGTTAMTITTAQRVGIGTTTPTTNLQVTGAGSGTFGAYNDPLNVKGSDYTLLYVNGTNGVAATIYDYNSTNGWYVGTNNSAGYRIGYMSSINQTGVSNAKDGSSGLIITTNGNFLVNGTTPIGTDGNLLANADYTATYRSVNNGAAFLHAFASDVSSTRGVVYAIYCNGTAGAVSDQNLKKNIEPARDYLADLMNIEVVKYNWISDEENAPKELGYIAQQVETVFPSMVDEQTYNDGDGNPVTQKMLKKEVFIPMMLKAIQELKAELDATKAEVAALKGAK